MIISYLYLVLSISFNSLLMVFSFPLSKRYFVFLCVFFWVNSSIFCVLAKALAVITSKAPSVLFWLIVWLIILAFSRIEMLKSSIFSNFVVIFADFHYTCSDFLRFSRKTLPLLEIYQSQSSFIMIIPDIHLIFDLIFD